MYETFPNSFRNFDFYIQAPLRGGSFDAMYLLRESAYNGRETILYIQHVAKQLESTSVTDTNCHILTLYNNCIEAVCTINIITSGCLNVQILRFRSHLVSWILEGSSDKQIKQHYNNDLG